MKIKRKGKYEYKREWHQNHSAMIVPMAAEAALVHGADISEFIHNHKNIHDFMLRAKVGRSDILEYVESVNDSAEYKIELQRTTRYYVSNTGGMMTKVSPPPKGYIVGQWKRANGLTDGIYQMICAELRNKPSGDLPCDTKGLPWDERINTKSMTKYGERRTKICNGYFVTHCNDIKDASYETINFDYYIDETNKLVNPLLT